MAPVLMLLLFEEWGWQPLARAFVVGFCMVVAAKIAGTAVAARLFQLTHPALMRMPWFTLLYTPWKRWKDQVLNRARASRPWQLMHRLTRRVKAMERVAGGRIKTACSVKAP